MMRLCCCIIALLIIPVQSAMAIDEIPNQTLLWNSFLQVESIGNHVLGLQDNGISILVWDVAVSELKEEGHLILPSPAQSMKLQVGALVVRHTNNDLSFVNIGPNFGLTLLGHVIPPTTFYDYALIANELFLSRWFDGIDRYSVYNFNQLALIANDKSGVVLTQLQTARNYFYALDMYNGIIRYSTNPGFGSYIDTLKVDDRPFAFSVYGDMIFVSMNSEGALVYNVFSTPTIIDTILNVPSPQKVLSATGDYVFLSEREVNQLDEEFNLKHTFPADSNLTNGAVARIDNEDNLLLPRIAGGITKFRLSNGFDSEEVLHRPGPVNSILIAQNHLFTGGGGNPLESYRIDGDKLLEPELLRGELTGITDLSQSGNQLYALYANEKKVLVFDLTDLGGVMEPADSLSITIDNAIKLKAQDSFVLIIGRNQIELHSYELGVVVWDFDKPIVEIEIQNDKLYVTNRFGAIESFTIQDDLSLEMCTERDLTGTGWAMGTYGNQLLVFTGNTLTTFNECLELDTIVHLPLYVLDAVIKGDTLYAVGPDGIAKYDLSSGLPIFVESGGLGGSKVSVDDGIIAITDGASVHLYIETSHAEADEEIPEEPLSVVLHENFPEPFNASTTIQFDLPSSSIVELSVYNLLGQRVRVLTDEVFSAGRHSVSWNGLDQNGLESSSGVYFYRLETNTGTVSRKMLLLK